MSKIKKLMASLLAVAMIGSMGTCVFANESSSSDEIKKKVANENEPFIVYIDTNGDEVFHNLPNGTTRNNIAPIIIDETKATREIMKKTPNLISSRANTYDTETNPIYIGTWSGKDGYARHTLGTQSSSGSTKYLTSQGDATWYNTKDLTALPYRNGNSTVTEHKDKIDVAKNTSFTITATNTGKSITVKVNDFGPQQKSDPGNKTIVDMDSDDFTTIFGDKSIGRSHCKTKVAVNQYYN